MVNLRLAIKLFILSSGIFVLGLGYVFVSGTQSVSSFSAKLRSQFVSFEDDIEIRLAQKQAIARERAATYDFLIRKDHLVEGMVVNRNWLGQLTSICDSLLFSNLRHVALKKLGQKEKAQEAWRAIEKSQNQGHWMRHPRCSSQGTSRDMIVGVLASLTQSPANHRQHLKSLVRYVEKNDGYIGHGPFHVSRVTPGIGQLIRLMARSEGMRRKDLHPNIRNGYSTLEIDTLMNPRGYRSHLNGMVLWIEMELLEQGRLDSKQKAIRGIASLMQTVTDPSLTESIQEQRHQWLTQRLVKLDPDNLFFRYLQIRAADALTPKAKLELLQQLLSMPQFPGNRLPSTCERGADYLWQRDSIEYQPRDHGDCHEIFSGIDFLWLAALLQ